MILVTAKGWVIRGTNLIGNDPVFGSDHNRITLISETAVETWPRMLKTELADKLVERIAMEFLT